MYLDLFSFTSSLFLSSSITISLDDEYSCDADNTSRIACHNAAPMSQVSTERTLNWQSLAQAFAHEAFQHIEPRLINELVVAYVKGTSSKHIGDIERAFQIVLL